MSDLREDGTYEGPWQNDPEWLRDRLDAVEGKYRYWKAKAEEVIGQRDRLRQAYLDATGQSVDDVIDRVILEYLSESWVHP